MRALLTKVRTEHILDIELPTDEGKVVNNKDLPKENQLVAVVSLANNTDKTEYVFIERIDGKEIIKLRPEACVKKYCSSLKGLEDLGITDGKSLVKVCTEYKELADVVMAIFKIICSVGADDEEKEEA